MKVTLESTEKVVQIVVNGTSVPARIWEGKSKKGIACHAYITRIAVANNDDSSEFEKDLTEHKAPTAEIAQIPLRLIL